MCGKTVGMWEKVVLQSRSFLVGAWGHCGRAFGSEVEVGPELRFTGCCQLASAIRTAVDAKCGNYA